MKLWVRLLIFFGIWTVVMPGLVFLMFKFPGRSVNTGMPDSGCFGWVGSLVIIFSFVILFMKPENKPDEPNK